MKKKKYRPNVFLKAAILINDRNAEWCCQALDRVRRSHLEFELFKRLNKPYELSIGDPWWPDGESKARVRALINTAIAADRLNNRKRRKK